MDNNTKRRLKFLINFSFYSIIIIGIFLAFKYAVPVLMPFLIGLIVAIIVEPLVSLLNKKFKIKRGFASLALVVLFWALAGYIIVLTGDLILKELNKFIVNISVHSKEITDFFNNIIIWAEDIIDSAPDSLKESLGEYLQNLPGNIVSVVQDYAIKLLNLLTSKATSIPALLLSMLISVISSCFISTDFPNIKRFIMLQVPEYYKEAVLGIKGFLSKTIFKLFKAYSLILFITFVELFIGFLVLRIEYAFTLAVLIAILDILPILGTGTVLIPWALYSFLSGNITMGVGLVILYVAILIIRQIIEPRIVGKQTGIHPVATLLAMYIGVKALGVIGIFAFPILLMFLKHMQDDGYFKFWKEKTILKPKEEKTPEKTPQIKK